VDLAGKTVMPALINVHVHIGYEGYTTWRAENHTPQNVLDHLQREAFYGTAVTQSAGSSPTEMSLQFSATSRPASLRRRHDSSSCPAWRRPTAGPTTSCSWRTTALHVVNEVSTAPEARAAVQKMAARRSRP
jgi:hypothetical protein